MVAFFIICPASLISFRMINLSHCFFLFSLLFVWAFCTNIFCQMCHTYREFEAWVYFPLLVCCMRHVNMFGYIMLGIRLHINLSLSSLCRLTWRKLTYSVYIKCPPGIFYRVLAGVHHLSEPVSPWWFIVCTALRERTQYPEGPTPTHPKIYVIYDIHIYDLQLIIGQYVKWITGLLHELISLLVHICQRCPSNHKIYLLYIILT